MNPADLLSERLQAGDTVVIDGGMGSELEARGVPMDRAAWSGRANLDHLDLVRQIHEEYINAGADVIIANTYATSRPMLRRAGVESRFEEANRSAVEAARAAREALRRPDVAIAGSISLGAAVDFMLEEEAPVEGEALRDAFAEQAGILRDAGVDLLALEMMLSPSHGVPAVEAALETGLPVWLGVSAALSSNGDVRALEDDCSFEDLLEALLRPELAAVTVMHSSLEATGPGLEIVRRLWRGPFGAYPESGTWAPPNWTGSDLAPEAFAETAAGWVKDAGARIIGGCCGIGPSFIEELRRVLN